MPEDSRILYHEKIHAELGRIMHSIANQTVKIRQIVAKISSILLKLDCVPLEQSRSPNETICHYKINNAIYHMTNIVEKYDRIKQDIFNQSEFELNDRFEEYLLLSIRRIEYLKTIARRLSAVADNITRIYGEISQEDQTDTDLDSSYASSGENVSS
ncbi:unnamed protein product [Hermetia illucens]|uniref:Uncharacterized protein n=1 Tax=Hermetia illucens TaxID=343691 RepID=A0A7R8YPH2_HERIL|nr:uncharacterized protein LOC119648884 [Hermetia illucens]CAD7080326.1 unnamed protein product [Hermetia illucens]